MSTRAIPNMLGLAEKNQESGKPACRAFFLPCPIRTANARVPPKSSPCFLCPRWLNKNSLGNMMRIF
jgi:hypothetical protein